jgi:biotin operon repressor
VDWESLSDQALWTAMNIALPIYSGQSQREVAALLGWREERVADHLKQLRAEIRELERQEADDA